MTDAVLAIDIGGTKTLAGLVERDGRILAERSRPTRDGGDDLERALRFGAELAASSGPGVAVAAVGVGVPEYVSPSGTVDSREVLSWHTQPGELIPSLFAAHGVPADAHAVGSDVRLGALGEARYGVARGTRSFFYVSLGTGLSSTFVVDDTPWEGARGQAIALGEIWLEHEGANLESFCSGTGIADRYRQEAGPDVTGPELVRRAGRGDAIAAAVLATAGRALGDALADVCEVLDPHAIVLGGGLGSADTPLRAAAETRYLDRTARRGGAAALVTAALGHRSALLGAAVLAWDRSGA